MTAQFAVVVDVAHDRLFEVSSAGLVAEVDHVRRGPAVRYHRVALNGRPFSAAWSGGGRIALWGQDGLGTIDTRTWTTHSLAPAIVGAVGTPFGLAAWSEQGITVYRPAGTVRLHALAGLAVQSAQSVGDYLYAQSGARRYAINLRTGVTYGPLSARATIVTPGFVSIP
jgi:hypothetical protein